MDKRESDFWWSIKGICIIAVICIHMFLNRNVTGEVVWIRQIVNFPVALFVFMAGYFVKTERVEQDCAGWLKKRLLRIAGPYFLCSAGYLLYACLVKKANMNYKGVIASLLLGTSNIQMYYCIVMFQLILLTPMLVKYSGRKWMKCACFIITAASVALKYLEEWKHCVPSVFGSFCGVWLFFYLYGICCGKEREYIEEEKSWKRLLAWVLVSGAFMYIEAGCMYRSEVYHTFSTSQVRVGNFSFVFCLINLLIFLSRRPGRRSGWLILLGKNSFVIYLLHMFVVDTLFVLYPGIHYLAVGGVTLAFSLGLCGMSKLIKRND